MIPENELNIIALAKAARKSSRVPAELLPFFSQHGKWIGAPWAWSRTAILSTARIMRGFELPSPERVRVTNGTRVLLTSLVLKEGSQTQWHEIHGNLLMDDGTYLLDVSLVLIKGSVIGGKGIQMLLPLLQQVNGDLQTCLASRCQVKAPQLSAVCGSVQANMTLPEHLGSVGGELVLRSISEVHLKHLVSVGGSVNITCRRQLHAPLLERIGGDFRLCAKSLVLKASKLLEVSGSLHAPSAVRIEAPQLVRIGGDADTRSAKDFAPRRLRVEGSWTAHPQAIACLAATARACQILRDSSLEISI